MSSRELPNMDNINKIKFNFKNAPPFSSLIFLDMSIKASSSSSSSKSELVTSSRLTSVSPEE